MKFHFFVLFLIFSIFSFGQNAELIVDFAPGSENGISEDATILGAVGDAIIIDNGFSILYSDGTSDGTRVIYDLSNSQIQRGEVYYERELYFTEFTSGDTSRIIKVNDQGALDIVLEMEGEIELYLSYKEKLYFNHRRSGIEFLYAYDPLSENMEQILELNWFRRDGLKDAAVFNDLLPFIKAKSASTINATKSLNFVIGLQPNFSFALEASPIKRLASGGRIKRLSCTT